MKAKGGRAERAGLVEAGFRSCASDFVREHNTQTICMRSRRRVDCACRRNKNCNSKVDENRPESVEFDLLLRATNRMCVLATGTKARKE